MSLTYTTVDGAIGARLDKFYTVKHSFLNVEPGNCMLPSKYALFGPRIRDLKIRDDDVWVVSYPRTGSHWAQEMVWCIGNDFDYKKAETPFFLRNLHLEHSALMVSGNYVEFFEKLGDSVDKVENAPSPRYLKSHLPWDLLPQELHLKKPKMVYVARNPKDMCVSFYHYCKLLHGIDGSFQEFADLMLEGYAPMGSFWSHVLKFWEHKDDPNILFLTYEEMKKDQAGVIRKTAKFLGKAVTEEQVAGLCEHLKFSKMAANPSVNMENVLSLKEREDNPNANFIRKGKVGDWQNYMNEELSKRFDDWMEKHIRGTGLKLDTSLHNAEAVAIQ